MFELLDIKQIDEQLWDDFIENHEEGNFFQTRHFFYLHKSEFNCHPFGYAVFEGDSLRGIMIGVTYHNYSWPLSLLTKRSVVMGGPLVIDNDSLVLKFIVQQVSKLQKNKSIYLQIRNLWATNLFKSEFEKYRYIYEDHLDIIHDLTMSNELLKTKISKNKRGNINKSINKGTTFKEIIDLETYKVGIDLIQLTYKKVGLPSPSKEFFNHAFDKLFKSGYLKAFGAFTDSILIGIRIELCYRDLIYDWYAGSDENYKNRYPNDFLPYHILFWGKNNGFDKFDFGGAGKPDKPYGVREHKLKFGGDLVNFGRYEKVNQPFIMLISSLGFRMLQSLKK